MRYLVVLFLLLLPTACGPAFPDLDNRLTPQSRAAGYPTLVPLDPLLAGIDTAGPRVAAVEGASLEARAAALRARAAWLRSLPL